MIDIGFKHVKEFAIEYGENLSFASNITIKDLDMADADVLPEKLAEVEEILCKDFGKFLADKDYTFGSWDFSDEERELSAYVYVDIYYRKALLKYFTRSRLKVLKKKGKR